MNVAAWIRALERAVELGVSPDAEVGLYITDGKTEEPALLILGMSDYHTHENVLLVDLEEQQLLYELPDPAPGGPGARDRSNRGSHHANDA